MYSLRYILLLFIATPVKYVAHEPQYVKLLGMPHGLLFIGYIILAFMVKPEFQWSKNRFITVLVASVIPFGTFYVDKKFIQTKLKP